MTTRGAANWFESALAQLVLERESETLSQCARRFHGDTMLWLGPVAQQHCDLGRCMVRSRVYGVPPGCSVEAARAMADGGVYLGEIRALPFRTAYMDAVVVHHGLDQAEDPRAAIREVARVVTPGGWLLICGFNPLSTFGMRHFVSKLGRGPFGKLKFISPLRLLDWLAVLDFEVDDSVNYFIYRLPVDPKHARHARWRRVGRVLEAWRIPFGAVYVVMARKRAVRLTESGARERSRTRFSLVPVPNPAPSPRARSRVRQSS
jgi:SAM-dependent methyltransferase